MSERSFGDLLRELGSTAEIVDAEREGGRSNRFELIDTVVAGLIIRAFGGERVVCLTRTERGDCLEIVGVPQDLVLAMRDAIQLEAQRARGAWFLPETVPIKIQALVFPTIFRASPRYAHTLAADEKGKVSLTGSADAMLAWSVLQSFADLLLGPISLRVRESGLLTRDGFGERWEGATASLSSLGLALERELEPLSWGGGWATFGCEAQLEVKAKLLRAVGEQLSVDVVRRYRASAVGALVRQYYAKAKKGRAKRRQVITKEHARTLAAYFGGDWLAFVEYLGEEPHEEEHIATALPEPKLIVTGKDRAAEIAAKRGVPVDEVERILGAYWKDSAGASPVVERAATLAEYWQHFDQIHGRQSRGMRPLWGLVEESGWSSLESSSETPYQQGLFRDLLPRELVARIERLWGTTVLGKWPDCVVTEPFPHAVMTETFGPGLKFWHGCALTAWFVCEGPRSRTDIPGLATYFRRELVELEDMGVPVHPQFFADLSGVPLGPEEPIYSQNDRVDVGHGLSMTIKMSTGVRRSGFELLRDVITHHRRWWASQNLERYLRALWETELKAAARQFHLMTEEKGKPPTLKQYAKHAIDPARHWFAGDVSLLFASLGQKLAANIRRETHMPADRSAFVNAVFEALGGRPFNRQVVVESREAGEEQAAEQTRHHQLRRLAGDSLTFLQLWEALGRQPTPKEFGSRFDYPGAVLAGDIGEAWAIYVTAISKAYQGGGHAALSARR
jgi:hypothetical protein